MFNLGPMELAIVLVLALLVFGPKKLPEIGKGVGQAMREFKRASRDLMESFHDSMDDRPRPATDTYTSPSAAEPVYPYEPMVDASGLDELKPATFAADTADDHPTEDGGTLPAPAEPDYQTAAPSSDEPSPVAATAVEPESPTARTPERTS